MRRCCTSPRSFMRLLNAHDEFARCPIGRGHSPRSRSHARPLRCPMSVSCHADTDTGTSPQYPSTFPPRRRVRSCSPAGDATGHRTPDGTAPPSLGPSFPFAVPEGSPENVPSSFRGVPFTRMRHTIGQPRKRPPLIRRSSVRKRPVPFPGRCPERPVPFPGRCPERPVPFSGRCPERPVPFSGRCPERPVPFPGRCPERPVPFPGRCPIAWAPLRTMGLPAQNGPLPPIYASLACHRPLPDADNGNESEPL
jgi:hypothetical protein